ncbi:ARL15 [Cervus elaphus hippelaphus]|uniref:ARL15 n=1 Tax=Cervus elaphus hippelaphus TaxID=46360 RepID=A0A212C8R5_CEREH|nr:ARL15 [Cervus elaphus hippelaphus]
MTSVAASTLQGQFGPGAPAQWRDVQLVPQPDSDYVRQGLEAEYVLNQMLLEMSSLCGTTLLSSSTSKPFRSKIFIRCFRALCCKGPPPARPEYDLVCIGLTGSGKTSLLSKLCSESPDSVVSTTGADNIRKYWSRYYQGSQGYVLQLHSQMTYTEPGILAKQLDGIKQTLQVLQCAASIREGTNQYLDLEKLPGAGLCFKEARPAVPVVPGRISIRQAGKSVRHPEK